METQQKMAAVGLNFNDILEMTLPREWSVRDMVVKKAMDKLKDRNRHINYDNLTVTVYGIECDMGEVEVIFTIEGEEEEHEKETKTSTN